MNGRVVAVLVKPGEQVAAGQPVMTLEAMKMEHVHTAGVAGTVSAIDVAEGEQVTTGKIVVEIEAAANSSSSRASAATDPYAARCCCANASQRPCVIDRSAAMRSRRSPRTTTRFTPPAPSPH